MSEASAASEGEVAGQRRHGPHLVAALGLTVASGLLFLVVASAVSPRGAPVGLDRGAQEMASAMASPFISTLMKAVTQLGRPRVVVLLSLGVIVWLVSRRSHRRLCVFAAIQAGGLTLNGVLKTYYQRARPSDIPAAILADGYSFPSGHTMNATVFFGSLAYVVYFTVAWPRRLRLAAVAACAAIVVLVAWSRVHLGVHYLSDVAGGMLAGGWWMGLCLTVMEVWVRWRDRRRVSGPAVALAFLVLLGPSPAAAQQASAPPCPSCVVWEVSVEQAGRLAEAAVPLDGLELLLGPAPAGTGAPAAWSIDLGRLQETLRLLRARGAAVGLRVGLGEMEALSQVMAAGDTLVVAVDEAAPAEQEAAFQLKKLSTMLHARHRDIRVGVQAAPQRVRALSALGLGAYLDFIVAGESSASSEGAPLDISERYAAPGRWIRLAGRRDSVVSLLEATRRLPGARLLAPWPGQGDAGDLPFALLRLRDVLGPGLASLPSLRIECEATATASGSACDAATFLDPALGAVALVQPRQPLRSLRLVMMAEEAAPGLDELLLQELTAAPPPRPAARRPSDPAVVELDGMTAPFLLRIPGWAAAQGRFAAGVDVVADRALTVEELLARHQAWMARQRAAVPRLISQGRMLIAFEVPGLSAPVAVTADIVLYTSPAGTDIEQRSLRLNGLSLDGGDSPRLPIVEPERVAVPPLSITLDEAYRYRLEGRERVQGHECHRVSFEPSGRERSLFRGTAWIESREYALVRLEAVQTGLRGPVVSSQQSDEFSPASHGGRRLWLLSRSQVHQVYESPGHRTPIDRLLVIERQEPDPPDFASRLAQAHASEAVMLRETPQGFRYLRRIRPEAGEPNGVAGTRPSSDEPGAERRVAGSRARPVRTVALGLLVDPNIGDLLPFAGLGYADFDLFGTGTQLNAFLAGSFAQLSWSAPALGGSRWQVQASAFASLLEYNDRVFRDGVERYPENLRQRPARLAVDLSHPLSDRWRLRAGYELAYTRLRRSELTAPDFVAPASALAHGLRLALEAQAGAWTASMWWRPAWRQGWRAWGFGGDAERERAYHRYGVSLRRSLLFSGRALARVEGSWMGGRGLDRFSRYGFDGFDNRLTGYPAASVRYDRGLVVRTAASWSARPWARLQAFADAAHVRDAGFGPRFRTLLGLGAGLEAVLPYKLLLAADWGWGPQGHDRDGGRGTHTLRLTAYRVF